MILGEMICLREKASSCWVSTAALWAARVISSTSSRRGSSSSSSSWRMPANPVMAVRVLLKSWATPPANRPMASIFCDWRSCSSRRFRSWAAVRRSVVSWHTARLRPSGNRMLLTCIQKREPSLWRNRTSPLALPVALNSP